MTATPSAPLLVPGSTTALLRLWGAATRTALTALGMVRTADTGQVDWTSVTVGSTNAAAGYEVWRFDDALQATSPVFFKIEYGLNSSSFCNWLTIGTGSDGAGNITGAVAGIIPLQIAPKLQVNSGSPSVVAAPTPCYFNGDGSAAWMFMFALNNPSSGAGWVMGIERSRDPDGNPTGDYVMGFLAQSNTTQSFTQTCYLCYIPGVMGPTAPAWASSAATIVGGSTGASVFTIDGIIYPGLIYTSNYGPRQGAPSQYILGYKYTEYGIGQLVAVRHYGVTKHFLTAGAGGNTSFPGWGSIGIFNSFMFRTD